MKWSRLSLVLTFNSSFKCLIFLDASCTTEAVFSVCKAKTMARWGRRRWRSPPSLATLPLRLNNPLLLSKLFSWSEPLVSITLVYSHFIYIKLYNFEISNSSGIVLIKRVIGLNSAINVKVWIFVNTWIAPVGLIYLGKTWISSDKCFFF